MSGIFHKDWTRNFQNVHLCSPEVDISMLGKCFLIDTKTLKTDAMNGSFSSVRFNYNHVTCYKFNSSHWLKLQHSYWRANLVKDSF